MRLPSAAKPQTLGCVPSRTSTHDAPVVSLNTGRGAFAIGTSPGSAGVDRRRSSRRWRPCASRIDAPALRRACQIGAGLDPTYFRSWPTTSPLVVKLPGFVESAREHVSASCSTGTFDVLHDCRSADTKLRGQDVGQLALVVELDESSHLVSAEARPFLQTK